MTRATTRAALLLLLALVAVAATVAPAQVQAPATRIDDMSFPAGLEGERYSMLLDAVNSHDLTLAERFYNEHVSDEFKEHFTLESFLDGYKWIASTTGGLDFHAVRTYVPARSGLTTLVCRDRLYGSWWAVVFHYGDRPEDGLTDMKMMRATMPDDVAADKITAKEFAAKLTAALGRVCEAGLFSGAVLVADGYEPIVERACGIADAESGEPVTMSTRFELGVAREMFLAVAVMQLAEQGRLSLVDPVGKHIGSPFAVAQRVTVSELMSHASASADSFALEFEQGAGKPLIGAVIESVAGVGLGEYLSEHVFGPAGMDDTVVTGEGHVLSTAPDLHAFTAALAEAKLVSGASIAGMWTDQSGGRGYGYGFAIGGGPKGLVVGHTSAATSSVNYDIYAKTGQTVVVLSDMEGAAWPVEALIGDLMVRLE